MIGAVVRCAARRLTRMRIAFLTGIWPPDVGGPATHGPDFARFLVARGHSVRVVTMGDGEPAERPCEVEVVSRRLPFPLRYGQVALRGARAARAADVVYATATYAAAAAAAVRARRPLVAKLVSDPAYERAQRYGLFAGTLEEFQGAASAPVRALKAARTRALRTATIIVVPSAYLAEIARGWGLSDARVLVLPNPAPPPRRGRAGARSSRAPSSSSAGSRGRRPSASRSRPSPAFPARSSSSSATGPSGPSSSAWQQRPTGLPACASSVCERATRRCGSSPAPRRASSRATGRTCRTRLWRRCRSACPWSRRLSVECPRS